MFIILTVNSSYILKKKSMQSYNNKCKTVKDFSKISNQKYIGKI